MSGEVPLGGGGVALRECMAYGTIASEVVTHRRLLQMCCSLNMEYTMSQPLKRPFHNNLEKCTAVNFLDRSLGKHIVAEALRQAGAPVEGHDDHFLQDARVIARVTQTGSVSLLLKP